MKTPWQGLVTKRAKIEIGKTNPKHRTRVVDIAKTAALAERGHKVMA